jgi:hypothetical protein
VRDAAQSALSELRVRKHPRCEVLFPMRRIAGGRKGTGPASGRPPPFAPRAEQPLQAQEESEGERKTVTALFADIKGSMELMEDLDPEEARGIVDPALKLMIDAVHRYDGYIVQSTGDGIFTLFGAPLAHEDHPQRALYAALRMQEEMRRYDHRMRARGQTPIQVRIGVNTCEVVVRSIQTGADHRVHSNRPFDQPCRAASEPRHDGIDDNQRLSWRVGEVYLRGLPSSSRRSSADKVISYGLLLGIPPATSPSGQA